MRLPACSILIASALLFGQAAKGTDGGSPWPKLEEVIVVSKTHFDIGYTELASQVVDRYRSSMTDQALKLVDESRDLPPDQRFSWTLAGWPMAQVLWPGQTPERRLRFLDAMREMRLVPHALPFTTHTESLDLEDLARGLRYSVELARMAGQPLPTDAKMSDVVSHAGVTATLLANAGVKFFHLGCNEGCSRPELPMLYWWEGPDGSRVLTMCSPGYGSGLCPPRDWPHKTWLCMWMTGDNHGPPNAREVNDLFTRARQQLPGVRVRFGRMSDFAEAILREKPELPVIRGEMPDTWIHGIGSMPLETQLAHTTRPRIAALECLDTLLATWGVSTSSAQSVVREAYEYTLLFGEHTWGPDVARYAGYHYGDQWKKKLAAGDFRYLLEGFDQKSAYARKAAALVDPALEQKMAALARSVNVPGRRIVVFNPLPWKRDGLVDVSWDQSLPFSSVIEPDEKEPMVAVVQKGRLRFTAKNLPPMGYRTYVAKDNAAPASDILSDEKAQRLENKFFRVTLDPARCGIRSIIEKRTGRELVNAQSPYALGQYLYERFDADGAARFTKAYVLSPESGENISHGKPNLPPATRQPYHAATAAEAALEIVRSVHSVTALLKPKPHDTIHDAMQLRVTLARDCPWIDLEWSITNKTPDPWPEAGWLCFPFRANEPTFRLARLGALVDPANLVPGANHEVFCLNGGLIVTGADGSRIGLCPVDAQLVSLEHPGLWRYSRDFVARRPDVFVNLFNNVYSTNFRQWIDGSWSSRVRLWLPEPSQSTDESLVGGSWEARDACLAAAADAPPGKLPPVAAGISITRLPDETTPTPQPASGPILGRGLLVTAFGPNPYGEGTLLRLWDQSGQKGTVMVRLPENLRAQTAQPCDLRGQPIGPPLAISRQGTFDLTIKPLAPTTLVLLEKRQP